MSLRCKNCGVLFKRGPHKCKTDMFGRPIPKSPGYYTPMDIAPGEYPTPQSTNRNGEYEMTDEDIELEVHEPTSPNPSPSEGLRRYHGATQPLSDEELREQLQDLFINEHQRGFETCAEGTGNWSDSNLRRAMELIHQDREARIVEAYKHGLVTGAMPEAIGKPIAEDYIARLTHKRKEK